MKFDDIFKEIGEFGPYQRRNYALLIIGWMITAPIMTFSVFVLGRPDHRCQIPGLDNDTYAVQGTQHSSLIHNYSPVDGDGEYDKCSLYDISQSATEFDNKSRPINATKIKCTAWVYSRDVFYDTFVMKKNLVCDDKYKISLSKTIFFAGVLTGSFVFGMISDRLGRRKTLLIAILFELTSTLALAWSYNYVMYVILCFCSGAACVGLFMTSYVIGIEWVGPSMRTYASLIIAFFGPVGELYLIMVSYFARDWFWIFIGISIPFGIDALIWWFIPESPRWLFSQGRHEEAAKILEKAAKYNKREVSSKILENIVIEKKEAGKIWLLFSDRRLGIRTVIIFYNWMVASMVFYGLSLNTGILYGDYYINFLIVVMVEFPGHVLPLLMIDRIGRKRSHFIYMGVGGLACLSTIFTVNFGGEDLQILTTALAMIGKMFATAAFATIYIISAELYPTAIRNVGMGFQLLLGSCWRNDFTIHSRHEIGEFGPYQRRNYTLLVIGWMLTGPIMTLSVFVMGLPDHRCQIPILYNDTYTVQGTQHQTLIHQYIPLDKDGEYDKCSLYDISQSATEFDNESRPINATKIKCSAWVYSEEVFYDTFVTKENLVCDDKYKISLTKTIFFAGVLTGSFIFGMISDILGRRKTLLIAILFELSSTLALAWSYNYVTYVILRFCTGAACVGMFMTSYVLGMEWVGPTTRTYAGLIIAFFGPVGELYFILVSYFARKWFWIIIAVAIPFGIDALIWWFIPESPRWLFSRGRNKEAAKIIEKAAKYNKKEISPKKLEDVVIEKREAGKIWLLFSDRRLGIRTVIIFYNWMVASMVFYGLSLNTGILYGDYYINFLIVVLVEFPGHALPLFMIDRFGRKKSHFIYMAVGGIACLSTIFTVTYGGKDLQILTTALAMVGKMFATAAFATIYVLSAELFPTAIRNAGMGSSSCWARVGGMISPFIADTADLVGGSSGTAVPLVIFGGACLIAAGLTLILPETLHQLLPETIEDGKNFTTKEYKERSKQYRIGLTKEIEVTKF